MKIFHPLNEYCMEIQKGLFLAWWTIALSNRTLRDSRAQ